MREVEVKFRVHQPFTVPELAGVVDRVRALSQPHSMQLIATYYDTPDLRLAREGITLRHRVGDEHPGWQLKLPVPGAGPGSRDEVHEPDDGTGIPLRLRDLVRAFTRTAPLEAVSTLRTDRVAYLLFGRSGRPLAELVDDRVAVVHGEHVAATFREIEVEDRGGGPVLLDAVGAVLRAHGAIGGDGLGAAFVPKVVQALGPAAAEPPDPPPPDPVTGRDPVARLIQATLRRGVRALMAQDPQVRRDEPDAVHQMRVACRRLRSALRTFRPLVDPDWADQLRGELGWLASALGGARDAEVLRIRILDAVDQLPEQLRTPELRRVVEAPADGDIAAAREQVLDALGSDRYITLLDRLVDAARIPRVGPAAVGMSGDVLPGLIDDSYRRLARRAGRTGAPARPEDYHRVRIAAKQARYTAEAAVPVLGRRAGRHAARMEQIQETLGEHQDAIMAGGLLRRIAGEAPEQAFGLGVLYGGQLVAAERARREFDRSWPAVARAYRKHGFRS